MQIETLAGTGAKGDVAGETSMVGRCQGVTTWVYGLKAMKLYTKNDPGIQIVNYVYWFLSRKVPGTKIWTRSSHIVEGGIIINHPT